MRRRLRWTAAWAVGAVGVVSAAIVPATVANGEPSPEVLASSGSTPHEAIVKVEGSAARVVSLSGDRGAQEQLTALRERPRVAWAAPNHRARGLAAELRSVEPGELHPNDPGPTNERGGWRRVQWNFLDRPGGVDAPSAWTWAREHHGVRHPGAGVVVAVVDSGVAFRDRGRRFRRNPDMHQRTFVRGRDFVDPGTPPLDETGHGTHVAATIAQATGNGMGLTGLAWGARVMPVRALGSDDTGTADGVARSIRWAAMKGADIINLSLGFGEDASNCRDLPGVCEAIRFAHRRGAMLIAAAGNGRRTELPAAHPRVMAVGSSTLGGCRAWRSPADGRVDLLAPGGGPARGCAGSRRARITQLSLLPEAARRGRFDQFGFVQSIGTTSAAPHASAAAAILRSIGASPRQAYRRLMRTASDRGEQSAGADELAAGSGRGAGFLRLSRAVGARSAGDG